MKFHNSLFNLIDSPTKLNIVRFLINHTASMSEREIASVLNVSHMSVNRTMRELAEVNFVNNTVVGRTHIWIVNRKSYVYGTLSKIIRTMDTTLAPIEDLKKTLLQNLPVEMTKKIILFGSVSKSSEEPNSDIDLFILVKLQKHKDAIEPYIEKLALTCLVRYGNVLSPYVLTEIDMKQKKNLNLMRNIQSGMQLYPPEK
jgi:predicted nucleotidyltransferase